MSSFPLRKAAATAIAVSALIAAGCGSDDEGSENQAAQTTPPAFETPPAPPEEGGDLTDTSVKPAVEVPEGEPPTELETEDIVEGEGEAAEAGDTLTMQYVGVSYATGEEFDASWDLGQPFIFELGAGMVIEGWDEGLVGMREGGRRQLVIPPDMAYGASGSPPAIGPDETLVFVVDLVEIG
ncbi:MAG: FKBP-type peptidyl-prolyl cis-trans isomerase [Solirubrobacteraceae bacterium MAG38_C4-C5]|nr:FKBP-type peptidyl-prolyl cis-trans isomerase [Candidatus Siliceabacter maunaloa]